MRVADKTTQRNYLKYLNNARNDYAETNMKIASGNRFTKLSDDVSAGTRMLNSRIELFKSEKQLSNVQAINNELKAVEDSMMSMNDVLNEIIGTKLVKAVTETTGEAGRVTIASEIKSMKEDLVQLSQNVHDAFLNRNKSLLEKIEKIEDSIDEKRGLYSSNHIARLNKKECSPSCSTLYTSLLNSLERMGDHYTFIARSLVEIAHKN